MAVQPISFPKRTAWHLGTPRPQSNPALHSRCFRGLVSSDHFRCSPRGSRPFRHSGLPVLASSSEVDEPQLVRSTPEDEGDAIVPPSDIERATAVSTSGGPGDEGGSWRKAVAAALLAVRNLVIKALSLVAAVLVGITRTIGKRPKWEIFVYSVVFVLNFPLLLQTFTGRTAAAPPVEASYSQFRRLAAAGHIQNAQIDESANRIIFDVVARQQQEEAPSPKKSWIPGRRTKAAAEPTGAETVAQEAAPKLLMSTRRIQDPELIPSLLAAGVNFGAAKSTVQGALTKAMGSLLGLWLPLLPVLYFMRKALGGGKSGAKDKNKGKKKGEAPPVSFQDVAGIDVAKNELLEVVQCLKDATRYTRLNASMPTGVLLCGPPGTGKTLLAKAVAGEAGVPFFAASASEFVELYVGRGAARVRELFAEARKKAPCVVFIDELDAVGGKRGIGLNDERDQTLNQLLTELDGFDARTGVLMLAATNRPEVLDSALTRPGRLSRKVVVPLPDEGGRERIMMVHLRKTPMASLELKRQSCAMVARLSAGMSGAELANVCNEAALLAGRRSAEVVEPDDLVEAVQRTRYGVNGNVGGLLPEGWRKKLNGFLVNSLSSNARTRAAATPV